MEVAGKAVDRISSIFLYLLIGVMVLWFGSKMVARAVEVRLFKDFLLHWEVHTRSFDAEQGAWPEFTGSNQAAYMRSLISRMARNGMTPPASNGPSSYEYRLRGFGDDREDIFVLVLPDRMVLYGIRPDTLEFIDRAVDGRADLAKGLITGKVGKNSDTRIGQWHLWKPKPH
jgi:hypothetical protein